MNLYEAVAAARKRKPAGERKDQILDCIEMYQEAHGKGPRRLEISSELGLADAALSHYINPLLDDGLIERVNGDGKIRYVSRIKK